MPRAEEGRFPEKEKLQERVQVRLALRRVRSVVVWRHDDVEAKDDDEKDAAATADEDAEAAASEAN